MENNLCQVYFIEKLTFFSWVVDVFPYFIFRRLGPRQCRRAVYFVDASKLGKFTALLSLLILGMRLEKLHFEVLDIRDEKGSLISLRLWVQDMPEVQKNIIAGSVFQEMTEDIETNSPMITFLRKQIVLQGSASIHMFHRVLFLIHVALWKLKTSGYRNCSVCFFMTRRLWAEHINKYAEHYSTEIIWTKSLRISWHVLIDRLLGISRARFIRNMFLHIFSKGLASFLRSVFWSSQGASLQESKFGISINNGSPHLMVEYYGNLNLDNPELNSDLFFWQHSQLPGNCILIIFGVPVDPFNEKMEKQLSRYGMKAIAINPRATNVSSIPIFYRWPKIQIQKRFDNNVLFSAEERWLIEQKRRYAFGYDYWVELFRKSNTKVYISWFKCDAMNCVIYDALRSLGGIYVNYQRSFEEFPTPENTLISDIVFGFSPNNAEIERKIDSNILYHIAVGYVGDCRFPLEVPYSRKVRDKLNCHGAKYIITFLDENSYGDPRWDPTDEFSQVNYEFLLKKVLKEPWLGIIFKPKVPSTLRKRLGQIAHLLKQAEETGRCFVFEGGAVQGSYPPAIAALASDIVIYGHLCGGTAGLESALAGIPTFLLDREGLPISKLYKLGKGKVVFTDWESLWSACEDYLNFNGKIGGLGDWSSILDELDPFRDGRAAERIGTYLKWLMDGFKAGLSRETIMADAAERYTKIWGQDKVTAQLSS